jgi:hypothetical protein
MHVDDDAEGATSPESLRPTDRPGEARWKAPIDVESPDS